MAEARKGKNQKKAITAKPARKYCIMPVLKRRAAKSTRTRPLQAVFILRGLPYIAAHSQPKQGKRHKEKF